MIEVNSNEMDYLYFGEYKNKERVRTSNHTMRRRFFNSDRKLTIERKLNNYCGTTGTCDKMKEIAVTDIDQYFDYGFWRGPNSGGYYNSHSRIRSFNTPDLWEDVEELLEQQAVKVSKEFSRYDGACKIHYDVPVNGHVLFPNTFLETKKKKVEMHWFPWNGKYYDPQYIYQYINGFHEAPRYPGSNFKPENYHTGHLKQICPLLKHGKDPQMKLGRMDGKLNRIASLSYNQSKKDYVEIDLGRVCELTHVGSLGGYPRKLKCFPRDNETENFGKRRKRRRYVYIIDSDAELCWVTRYRLEFRDIVTGKWRPYDSTFVGNKDICTENIHKISLIARYVRVIPLDYHNGKAMRVLLYGEGFRSKIEEADLEVDTIRYTISPPARKDMLDGYGEGRWFDSGGKNHSFFRNMFKDEVFAYYHQHTDELRRNL